MFLDHLLDEDYEPPSSVIPPFMLAFSGDLPPIPPVPTSPPMPPKRRISVPLEPPQLKHKSFPDPPPHHPKPTKGGGSESSLPRYAELSKKPDFFLQLASTTIKCISQGIVQSEHVGTQKLLYDKLKPEILSQIAWLILNIGSFSGGDISEGTVGVRTTLSMKEKREAKRARLADSSLKQELSNVAVELMDMIHEMILNDLSQHLMHDVLLHELGLTAKCWSLSIPHASLSVLGRILVCRLHRQSQSEGTATCDDPLTVRIWNG